MAKIIYVSAIALFLSGLFGVASAQGRGEDSRYLRQPLPERWTFTQDVSQTLPTDDVWWKSFGDTTLDSLIVMGIKNNFNVSEALRRKEMARLAIRQAQSSYFPMFGATVGYTRSHTRGADSNNFSVGVDMSWEIDVFGKITSQVKAKKAAYAASQAEYLATMISITADLATYYVNYRVLQNDIAVVNEHIESQAQVLKIAEARHEAGLVSKLDVAQAKTVYLTTKASLPSLKSKKAQTLNAIATLLGVYAPDIEPLIDASTTLPPYQKIVPTGVPANLLRRRPDIAEAEATLAGYAASIGIAKKDFLPTLTLNGSLGWGGDRPGEMFNSDHFTYSIAPKLSWTIFDGFSRKYAVAQAREQMLYGIDAYNLTVMNAYTEVENAMTSYNAALESLELNSEVFAESHDSFDLSMEQYKQGLSAFTNVVNAQIDWLSCAQNLVAAHGDAVIALIDLYKALGGSPVEY